jgi:glucose-6-phosphate isomerase
MLSIQFNQKSNPDLALPLAHNWDQFKLNSEIGYLNLPSFQKNWDDSKHLGEQLKKNYDHLVLVGIGGSSMGPRFLAEYANAQTISFLDNIDSIETESILNLISTPQRIAWLFISKSGTTIEVLWTLELIIKLHEQAKKDFWNHTFFITEKTKNTLHSLSLKHDRPCLEIPLNVGGRFSVLSPVGLVVAQYLGLALDEIQKGALLALDDREKVIEMSSQYLQSMERGECISAFWLYSSRTRWFGQWLQQLWAESLGKKTDRDGKKAFEFSTPMACVGASDQHSILQQLIDGPQNKFVTVFRFKNVENSKYNIESTHFPQTEKLKNFNFGSLIKAEALATHQALNDHQISTALVEVENLNEKTIGYLFMFYQLVISTMAEYKNINAYDQPAVEHGKKLIQKYLNS